MRSWSLDLIISVLFLFWITVSAQILACDDSAQYQTYDQLKACLTQTPYNNSIKVQTVQTLMMTVPSYVFVDSILNSPDPEHIPMSVNLTASLQQIRVTTYNNDNDMQSAFASLFTSIQDAHTRYTKPIYPYCGASFVMPFDFYSRVEGNPPEQNIYIKLDPELVNQYQIIYGTFPGNGQDLDNTRVLTINNVDVLTAIGNFANSSVGYSKDYSARFNLAVDGYGGNFRGMYTWRNQSLQSIPSTPLNIVVDLPSQGTNLSLSFDWLGIFNPFFNYTEDVVAESRVGVHQLEFEEKARGLDRFDDYEEPLDNPGVYYQLFSNGTGVLRIYTFAPTNSSAFIQTIQEAVIFFNQQNISQLIIDVIQNGGGYVCLGYAVDRFLFPDLDPLVGAYDIKASPLFNTFALSASAQLCNSSAPYFQMCGIAPSIAGYFTPCAWYDWFSGDNYFDESWFFPGNQIVRGGVLDTYSLPVKQGCADEFIRWIPGEISTLNLDSSNIILLSDGLCGSTCAVFTRHLQIARKVKTVTVGGVLNGQKPSPTSFPGGEVVDFSYIAQLADRYQANTSSLIPPPFPTTAGFRFAIREILGWEGITLTTPPQEFTYLPGDFQIFYRQDTNNHTDIWDQLLPLFETCAPWETKSCAITNGIGMFQCINGSFSEECVPQQCDPGYIIPQGEKICIPCGLGFYKSNVDSNECSKCIQIIPSNCEFTQTGHSTAQCPFACTECISCPTNDNGDTTNANTICVVTWLYCLILVTLILLSFTCATTITCMFSKKVLSFRAAFKRRREQKYKKLRLEEDDDYDTSTKPKNKTYEVV